MGSLTGASSENSSLQVEHMFEWLLALFVGVMRVGILVHASNVSKPNCSLLMLTLKIL